MYKIEFLQTARDSLEETVRYICNELHNPQAARRFRTELYERLDHVSRFPLSCPAYESVFRLKHDYRLLLVKNYYVLYWVDENVGTVVVEEIIYARRDIEGILSQR